jgi:molybdopterin/thiamine biosynthesis adenylyltransferase
MRPWIEAHPGRLEHELEAFERADGLDFALDQEELEHTGRVILRGTLALPGREPIELEVRYPASFPYLRPEVYAPTLKLPRHQNPYLHNLCLLDASTRQWNPSETGAWLVAERVPKLLGLLEGDPDVMRHEEAPQGEPASAYFGGQPGTVVFVPEAMLGLDPSERGGVIKLSTGVPERGHGIFLRVCLSRVIARNKGKDRSLAVADEALAQRFGTTSFDGTWVRLNELPAEGSGTPSDLWTAAQQSPAFVSPPWQRVDGGGKIRILGIVCSEEVRQGEYEDVWLFVIKGKNAESEGIYVARGSRLSPTDLFARIPTLQGLEERKIAVAGLGALGAPVTLELARAQVGELRLLDHDFVEAGTIVRWPRGTSAVGHLKTRVLEDAVSVDYPFTTVRTITERIGDVSVTNERETLSELFDGVDLIVDATAEIGIQQLLAALADDAKISQVYVWATEGGWGGVVARVVPGQTGCWLCLQHHLADKTIAPPPVAETGTVQPRGCTAPTWTGTSFDALPLVAQTVRTATFTLLAGRAEGGPDVFVCHQRAEGTGELHAPRWAEYELTRHPSCPLCHG